VSRDGATAHASRPATAGVRARACVATELRTLPDGACRSWVRTLRAEVPLVPRITRAKGTEPWVGDAQNVARVHLAAGGAGPVGGDRLALDIDVGAGSTLVLRDVSATLVLPGPGGARSRTLTSIRVASGGTLVWLLEPLICARGADHVNDLRVDLEGGARLVMREEVLLGRHGETAGTLRQRTRVRLGGKPLFRQDLDLGTPDAGSPAVTGQHRAVGSVLVVDPAGAVGSCGAHRLPGDAAVLPLRGPAVLVTALAGDNLELRSRLEAGLAQLGPPWSPRRSGTPTDTEATQEVPHAR
jgi:urease accessory protein